MSFFYPFDSVLRISDFPSDVFDVDVPSSRHNQRQLTGGSQSNTSSHTRASVPKMDLIDNKDKLTCVVELPGLKEDVNISLQDKFSRSAGGLSTRLSPTMKARRTPSASAATAPSRESSPSLPTSRSRRSAPRSSTACSMSRSRSRARRLRPRRSPSLETPPLPSPRFPRSPAWPPGV